MIYVSTAGFPKISLLRCLQSLYDYGIRAIELSGGSFEPELEENLIRFRREHPDAILQIHNYFPPPSDPFVFNLASANSVLAEKSRELAVRAIRLAACLERPVYALHAGYRFDPQVISLGKSMPKMPLIPRKEARSRFLDNLFQVSEVARLEGVRLLLENNVVSMHNFSCFGESPFLLVEPEESKELLSLLPRGVRMLLDFAHLKVSANSLNFDPLEFIGWCRPWISAAHLSDNDGREDSHQSVSSESWFWKHIPQKLEFTTLEIHDVPMERISQQVRLVSKKLIGDERL